MNIAQSYHNIYTKHNLEADRQRKGRLAFVTDLFDTTVRRVLDVGCGPGVQFCGGADSIDLFGVDISARVLAEAAEHGYRCTIADVSKPLPFKSGTFDAVVLTDILEHLVEPETLLLEARRVLRQHGVLIASVPNHFFLWNRLRILSGHGVILPWQNHQAYKDYNYFHLRFFRWRSFLELLGDSGFDVENDLSSRFPAPLPPRWRRLIRHVIVRWIWKMSRSNDMWALHFMVVCRKRDLE